MMRKMQINRQRYNNYDLLRIISTIAVILIHVNYMYFQHRAYEPQLNVLYCIESFLNIITRFSVPVFIMISGGFNLKNSKNGNLGEFYKKTIWKIFFPAAGAMILFLIIDGIRTIIGKNNILLGSIKGIITGGFYNLWFLYMLAGLYILTPFVIKLKEVIAGTTYKNIAVLLMFWAVVSQAVSSQKLAYAIGVVVSFLGYYLLGDVILSEIKLRYKAKVYFLIALLMFIFTFVVRYFGITYYLFNAYTNFFSPFIVVASICIFAGVKQLEIKKDFAWLSGKTFYIYIFHTITYKVIFFFIGDVKESIELAVIFGVTALTFVISLGCAVVFEKIWNSRNVWQKKWYELKLWNNLT